MQYYIKLEKELEKIVRKKTRERLYIVKATNCNNQETLAIVERAIAKIVAKIACLNKHLRVVQQQIKVDKIVDKIDERVYNQTSINKVQITLATKTYQYNNNNTIYISSYYSNYEYDINSAFCLTRYYYIENRNKKNNKKNNKNENN